MKVRIFEGKFEWKSSLHRLCSADATMKAVQPDCLTQLTDLLSSVVEFQFLWGERRCLCTWYNVNTVFLLLFYILSTAVTEVGVVTSSYTMKAGKTLC